MELAGLLEQELGGKEALEQQGFRELPDFREVPV
jgi:hypothetical protein